MLAGRARTSACYRMLKRLGFHLWHPAMESKDSDRRIRCCWTASRSSASTSAASCRSRMLTEIGRGVDVHSIDRRGDTCAQWRGCVAKRSVSEGWRQPPQLLHEHPPGRDLGRDPRQPRALPAAGSSAACRATRPSAWACDCRPSRRERCASPGAMRSSRLPAPTRACTSSRSTAFRTGPSTARRVKEGVYLPDWRDAARLEYTNLLADLLAQLLLPAGRAAAASAPCPGAFKPNAATADDSRAHRRAC